MSGPAADFLFVAADDGPRGTLLPLANACGRALENARDEHAGDDAYWHAALQSRGADALIVGTSDSAHGRRVESAARRAAAQSGIAIAAIEDFPGNYYDVADGGAGLVVVESEFPRTLHTRKFGPSCPRILVIPPARYDPYRVRHAELRRATAARWAQSTQAKELVLWAGQPETGDALLTLRAVLPLLRDRGATLLFKAHPRDPGYRSGAYSQLFASPGVGFQDVTERTVTEALELAPRLVITQFSSLAVEAGFYGVPSVHLLFANAGGARLMQKKGYPVPPLCLADGADFVTDEGQLAAALSRALRDNDFRIRLIGCFDDYFRTGEATTSPLVQHLIAFASVPR